MTIRNLTPHAVTIHGYQGTITIQPDGPPARLAVTRQLVGEVFVDEVTIPINRPTFGLTEGLPEAQPDTLLLVSALVAEANKHRRDLVSPGELVRDEAGNIVGARGLCSYFVS